MTAVVFFIFNYTLKADAYKNCDDVVKKSKFTVITYMSITNTPSPRKRLQ